MLVYIEPPPVTALYLPAEMAHVPRSTWRDLQAIAARWQRRRQQPSPSTATPTEMAAYLLCGSTGLDRQGAAALAREYQSPPRRPHEFWVQVEWVLLTA